MLIIFKVLIEFVKILLLFYILGFFFFFFFFLAARQGSRLCNQGLNLYPIHWKAKFQPLAQGSFSKFTSLK